MLGLAIKLSLSVRSGSGWIYLMFRISGGNCPFDIVLILNIHYWSLIYIDRRCTQVLRLKLLGTEERFSWKVTTGDDRERIITMMTMTSTTRAIMINWRNIVQDVQRGGGESTQPDHTPGRFFLLWDKLLCFFLWLSQTCGSKVLNIDIICVLPGSRRGVHRLSLQGHEFSRPAQRQDHHQW